MLSWSSCLEAVEDSWMSSGVNSAESSLTTLTSWRSGATSSLKACRPERRGKQEIHKDGFQPGDSQSWISTRRLRKSDFKLRNAFSPALLYFSFFFSFAFSTFKISFASQIPFKVDWTSLCHVSERDVSADRSHIFQQIHAKKKKNSPRRRCGSSRGVIGRTIRAAGSQSSEMWDGVTSSQKNATLTILVSGAFFYFILLFWLMQPAAILVPHLSASSVLWGLSDLSLVILFILFLEVFWLGLVWHFFFILFFFYYFFLETEEVHVCEQLSDTTMNRGSGRSN